MADYSEDIALAREMIDEAGQVCEWRKTTVAADPDRPWQGGVPTTVVKRPTIAFLPATDGGDFGITKFKQGGDDSPAFSTYGLMAPQDFEPAVTDVLLRGGVPQTVVAIDVLRPAEQAVLYILSIA